MALATLTKDLLDRSTVHPARGVLQTVIASPAAMGARELRDFSAQVTDKQAALTITAAIASGSAVSTSGSGYPKTVVALAMVLGSYDAARNFLAFP